MYAIYDDVVYHEPAEFGRATDSLSSSGGKSFTLSSASACSLCRSSSAAGSSGVLGLSTALIKSGSSLGFSCLPSGRRSLDSGYYTKRLNRGSETMSLTASDSFRESTRESLCTARARFGVRNSLSTRRYARPTDLTLPYGVTC